MRQETVAVHAGRPREDGTPMAVPIAIASAYGFETIDSYDRVERATSKGYTYSRDGSPTSEQLEAAMAEMEGGQAAVALSAGVAAISMTLLALLPRRGTIVAAHDVFGGTNTMLREVLEPLGYNICWVDFTAPQELESALESCLGQETLVLCESIGNPQLRVPDLAEVSAMTHRRGARLVVDNTFATPWFCRPLDHGADVVLHSASKFLGGHSDVVGGLAIGSQELIEKIRLVAIRLGARLDPFASWLALRGLRTLPLRMETSAKNAAALASELVRHPAVEAVMYPGLASTQVTDRMLPHGCGAMVSFVLRAGSEGADAFVRALEMIQFVGSLGDVATSVSHPPTTSHRGMSRDERRSIGIADGFIRISVGIEAAQDIIVDVRRGLDAALVQRV